MNQRDQWDSRSTRRDLPRGQHDHGLTLSRKVECRSFVPSTAVQISAFRSEQQLRVFVEIAILLNRIGKVST